MVPPPILRVLVFGEGTGGGALRFTAALFEVVAALGGPPAVEFEDTPGGPGGGRRGEPCNDEEDVAGEGPCIEPELCRLDDDEATPPRELALTVEALLLLAPEEEAGGGPGGGRRGEPCRDDDDVVPPRLERLGEV